MHYRGLRRLALWLADILVGLLSFYLALHLRFKAGTAVFPLGQEVVYAAIVFISTFISLTMNLDQNFMRRGWFDEITAVLLHDVALGIFLVLVFYLLHNAAILSRLVYGYFLLINFVLMLVERGIIKAAAHRVYGADTFRHSLLMITDPGHVNSPFDDAYSYKIIGNIVVNGEFAKGIIDNKELSCPVSDLTKNLVTVPFDDVFIHAPSLSQDNFNTLMERFTDMGVIVHNVLDISQPSGQVMTVSSFGGDYLCANYSKHEFNRFALGVKRFFDILGGIVGLAICGIIFIFLAPAIKLDSPGPVIFSQIRIGRNGKRFKFYKFRSMYIDAEERKKNLIAENEMNGLMFKMDDDPRITKVGKFIRKTSLDEFPQFWNVLKGDMSLVGTRPPTEDEFMHYNEHYRERLSIRPGITGLWQVSGRSDITNFDDVVKLDLRYIDHWSLGLDARILFKTVSVVFKHKGAK